MSWSVSRSVSRSASSSRVGFYKSVGLMGRSWGHESVYEQS